MKNILIGIVLGMLVINSLFIAKFSFQIDKINKQLEYAKGVDKGLYLYMNGDASEIRHYLSGSVCTGEVNLDWRLK